MRLLKMQRRSPRYTDYKSRPLLGYYVDEMNGWGQTFAKKKKKCFVGNMWGDLTHDINVIRIWIYNWLNVKGNTEGAI